jgi:biopolymer transport protein ExbD
MDAIETGNKKKIIQIDFAPMVDLGLLLITFFFFTTELSKPKAFGLHLPDKNDVTNFPQTPESTTITCTLKENGVVDFYEGNESHPLALGTVYLNGKPSLRDQLMDKRNRILQQHQTDEKYTVLIQPTPGTDYKSIVDVLDEMTINEIKKYMLLDEKQ